MKETVAKLHSRNANINMIMNVDRQSAWEFQ